MTQRVIAWHKQDWSKSSRQLADELGCAVSTVNRYRYRGERGIPCHTRFGPSEAPPKAPPKAPRKVSSKVPRKPQPKPQLTAQQKLLRWLQKQHGSIWDTAPLGLYPDAVLAEVYGVSFSFVRKHRKARGIPPCSSKVRDLLVRLLQSALLEESPFEEKDSDLEAMP